MPVLSGAHRPPYSSVLGSSASRLFGEMPIQMAFLAPRPWPSTSWFGLTDQVWDAVSCFSARATGASCNSRQGFLVGRVNPPTWYVGASDHHSSHVLLVAEYCCSATGYVLKLDVLKKKI
jgi:hypothetical protein